MNLALIPPMRKLSTMKTLTVSEAQGCLAELIAHVNKGEIVVLKNGNLNVTLRPGLPFDPNIDSPELEAELLQGIDEPTSPYSSNELDAACREAAKGLRK